MPAINTHMGAKTKDGQVLHNERVAPGCYFTVFASFHQPQNSFLLHADMTNGQVHTWNNGVTSMDAATVLREWAFAEPAPGLDADLQTADGFRVWQTKGEEWEVKPGGKKRRDIWHVEVPKEALLRFIK